MSSGLRRNPGLKIPRVPYAGMIRIRFQGSLPHAGDSQPFWAPRAKERRPIFEDSLAVGRSRGCDHVAARSFVIPTGYSPTVTHDSSNALTFDYAVPRFP